MDRRLRHTTFPPTRKVTDLFSSADGTNIHGKETTTGRQFWNVELGTGDCNTGQLRPVTLGSGVFWATFDSGLSNFDYYGDVTAAHATNDGLFFRYVDSSNYWRACLQVANDRLTVSRCVAGVETSNNSGTFTITAGITYSMRIEAVEGSFTVSVDGVQRFTQASTVHQHATRCGVIAGSTSARFDNLAVL